MAKFGDVFSTTGKVVLALVIISVGIGLTFEALGGLGNVVRSPQIDQYQIYADETRTGMPTTNWEKGLGRAVKEHCVTDGMSGEEVVRRWGEPS
jgi:hypothetical protein